MYARTAIAKMWQILWDLMIGVNVGKVILRRVQMKKTTIFEQIKRELGFIYDDEEITLKTDFVEDLNMDSLDMVELISDTEDRFNINADNFSEKPLTVEDLVDEIWEQMRVRK